jgi:hypothetical protein
MHEYNVRVTRDGRWWMIEVPEIDGLTQARRVSEIEEMARSLIAISTDVPLADVRVRIDSIEVPTLGDIARAAHHIEDLRDEAHRLEVKAAQATQQFARDLTTHGIPVRDVAALLHLSPQRVSQLACT